MAVGPKNGIANKLISRTNEAKRSKRQEEPEKGARKSHYIVVAGLTIDRNCRTAVVADKTLERVAVVEGTTTIRQECFSHGNMKTVHVPASVQKIESGEYDEDNEEYIKYGAF